MGVFSAGAQNYCANFIIEMIKDGSSRLLRKAFSGLKEWRKSSGCASSCYHENVEYT